MGAIAMTTQTDIDTLRVPGISRIPLSRILVPQDAVDALTDKIMEIHRIKQSDGNPHPHVALIGNDTEILWNVLLNYYRGEKVDLISGDDYVVDDKFVVPENLLQELLGWLIDVDISDEEIKHLPKEHPFWVIKDLLDIYEAKREVDADDHRILAREAIALEKCTDLIAFILRGIYTNDNDLTRYRSDLKETNGNHILLENGEKIDADYVFKKEYGRTPDGHPTGYGRLVDQSLNFPAIDEDEGRKVARGHHQTMVRAATYLDNYETALAEFSTKPSDASRQLFNRIQLQRPQLPQTKRPKVSVIGLGPSGLMAAIQAYQKGAIVTGIEKRASYSRNNTYRFTPIVMEEICKLFVDSMEDIPKLPENHPLRVVFDKRLFGEKLPSPTWGPGWDEFIPITFRDFEYLLYSWIQLVEQEDPAGMRVLKQATYVPGSFKGQRKSIEVIDEKGKKIEIPTDFVVGADGYHSQCRKDAGIGVYKMSTSANYGTYNYHPIRGDEHEFFQSLLKPIQRRAADLPKLKALGWEFDREPVPRFFNTGNHPYLGVEIPDAITNEYRRLTEGINQATQKQAFTEVQKLKQERAELMDKWGRATIAMFISNNDLKNIVIKDYALIEVQLQKSVAVTAVMPSGLAVFLIGDAAQAAHFQTGSGAIYGLFGAYDFGKFIEAVIRIEREQKFAKTPHGEEFLRVAMKAFEKSGKRRGVALHEWAFGFPSKEDLRVKPTSEYFAYRRAVRLEQIEESPATLRAETPNEAQAKALAKTKQLGRRR